MQSETAIAKRLAFFQHRIDLLQAKYELELQKPFKSRDVQLMQFLLNEISVYQYTHAQLQWVTA